MKTIHLTLAVVWILLQAHTTFSQSQFNQLTNTIILMEDEIQGINIVQNDRGNGYYSDVKSEAISSRGSEYEMKRNKLNSVLAQMDEINSSTETVIAYIDELKKELIEQSGSENAQQLQRIISRSRNGSQPARMVLSNLISPLNRVTISSTDSSSLAQELEELRKNMIQAVGTYDWGKAYHVNTVETLKAQTDNQAFRNLVLTHLNRDGAMNEKEDGQVLIDLYSTLWSAQQEIGLFQTGALLTNLSLLSAIEQRILAARALALAHWKSKVSTCGYGFDSILPIVYGPSIVTSSDTFLLVGIMAAFDSNNQPTIVVTSHPNAVVRYDDKGKGIIEVKNLPKGEHSIEGTISIKNKSGVVKTEEWKTSVLVTE